MTNLSLNKQLGAATFLIAALLLISAIFISIFSANYSRTQQKVVGDVLYNTQAYEAAEAGLEFGINYLQQNSAVILAGPVNGYIQPYSNSNTQNVVLANGSQYTVTYTNPVQNNYSLIQVTSTGTNGDGSATRVVSQEVEFGSILFNVPTNPLVGKGSVSISGSNTITNLQGPTTIVSGSTVSLSGSTVTQAQGGVSSTPGHINSDIQQNVASLSGDTVSDFFSGYFGASMTAVQNSATYVYNNLSNYSTSLNGKKGVTIWINQTSGTADIAGSTVIGTSTQPVLLIVDGNLSISGSTVIYGLVVVLGTTTTTVSGSSVITGGLIASDALTFSGSNSITYSSSTLSTIQQTTSNYYAKVPGTWRDF